MTKITLDRRDLLAPLFPDHQDWLFVSGLAGSSKDAAGLTQDGANLFTMAGCMGAALATGLGMALSAPDRKVAVITGDGELQMGLGTLNTIATQAPANLTVVCIDNGTHGETGGQEGHTIHRTNLAMIAQGAGIPSVKEISSADQIAQAHDFIRTRPGPRFLWCRVLPTAPTAYKRNLNPAECRIRFRAAYLGA
ncbi:MAG: thiamine pyrophosphate-binding protein [Rhodospirillales bacterium CG15_BIG_FIL_POST_REV_8_21_14_020_66_15]|nr:MAG: thiamine pyrophosphate-binding protein [Rhodospirillales bacterium CG15_BIG_FIL_POST_REV_8_21_14_020_66_15]